MKRALIYISGFALLLSIIIISCKKDKDTEPVTCPSTSKCGCSAKTKAECEASTDCCKWVVGDGCGCK